MQTMHSVLLVGPYDWQPELVPAAEYRERLSSLWELVSPDVNGLIVYGDTRRNDELVYLTAFTPKVRQAMALVMRGQDPRVLVPGTKAGLVSAKRLTWVAEVELLGDPAKAVTGWKAGLKGSGIGLLGGAHMRAPLFESIQSAAQTVDLSATFDALAVRKRPREWPVLRQACGMLRAGEQALRQGHAQGLPATSAVLKAEHAAWKLGAQDVQILFSVDGGRTLRPFEETLKATADPLQTYIAVRHAGYWAAGFVRASRAADPLGARAQAALRAMVGAVKPGASAEDLIGAARSVVAPLDLHPMVATKAGSPIGTGLEGSALVVGGAARIEAHGCYLVQAGVRDGDRHALASAMVAVAVGGAGTSTLWTEQVNP